MVFVGFGWLWLVWGVFGWFNVVAQGFFVFGGFVWFA